MRSCTTIVLTFSLFACSAGAGSGTAEPPEGSDPPDAAPGAGPAAVKPRDPSQPLDAAAPGSAGGSGGAAGASAPGGAGGQPQPSFNARGDLTNVKVFVNADNALISFDAVDGARDYRVYLAPLTPNGAVDMNALPGANGNAAMPNATFRCAGEREVPGIRLDSDPNRQGESAHATLNGMVSGFARTTADATLGHVYLTEGPGRVPVYALGDSAPGSDNTCVSQRWDETRVKKYVTAASERQALAAQGWRDYGVAFYAAAEGTPNTVMISTAFLANAYTKPRLYLAPGPELTARAKDSPAPAFLALASPAAGTVPLRRVYYQICGRSHDELVAGEARFQRATRQGNTPLTYLQWSGLTGPTLLVVEALDQGCPWQGLLSPVAAPASGGHQPFLSMMDIRAADPNREVFVNGQHDDQPRPRAIARSIVQVSPQPPDKSFDFHDGFDTDPGPFVEAPYKSEYLSKRFQSDRYDLTFNRIDYKPLAIGVMLKEFWLIWGDGAHDLEAKFRMTPRQKAMLPTAAASFLHVTLQTDIVSTGRRYPQLIISDRDAPVQDNMAQGVSVVVQTFGGYPNRLDIELCDHKQWTVTGQCPRFLTDFGDLSTGGGNVPPAPVIGELAGVDRLVRWDVYASTERVYALLDGQPVACAILPKRDNQPVLPAGPVTVSFGDVLYHSGIDVPAPPYNFHAKHLKLETQRHLDEFAWKSGVAAPAWNEAVPCVSNVR